MNLSTIKISKSFSFKIACAIAHPHFLIFLRRRSGRCPILSPFFLTFLRDVVHNFMYLFHSMDFVKLILLENECVGGYGEKSSPTIWVWGARRATHCWGSNGRHVAPLMEYLLFWRVACSFMQGGSLAICQDGTRSFTSKQTHYSPNGRTAFL